MSEHVWRCRCGWACLTAAAPAEIRHDGFVKAFSLIEVMIASAMLSIGLAAVMTAYGSASSLESHQEKVTQAMHLAEARMEELLLMYPDDADLGIAANTGSPFNAQGNPGGTAFYTVGWTVAAGPIARTRRLEVRVSWTEPRGAQQLVLVSHRS